MLDALSWMPVINLIPVIFVFILGTVFGSFGNVLILRLPAGESISGRSRDKHTGKTLRAWELIPIVSFLFLRGRSRYSGKRLSLQYPLIEAASGILFVVAWLRFPTNLGIAALFALALWLLLLIAVVDAYTQSIPDAFNIPLLLCTLLLAFFRDEFSLLSLVIGVLFLGLQWLASGGRWVGSGDIFLIASIGLLIGDWKNMLLCLMLAYVIGSVVAISLIAAKKKSRRDPIAFAPFLVTATYVTLLWGDVILRRMYGI